MLSESGGSERFESWDVAGSGTEECRVGREPRSESDHRVGEDLQGREVSIAMVRKVSKQTHLSLRSESFEAATCRLEQERHLSSYPDRQPTIKKLGSVSPGCPTEGAREGELASEEELDRLDEQHSFISIDTK